MGEVTGSLVSEGKMNVSALMRFNSPFQDSFIRGEGMKLGKHGKVEFSSGRVEFNAPLKSEGLLNFTGGKMRFDAPSKHEIGGAGLIMDSLAELVLEKGEMEVTGPLVSEGKMNVSALMRFNSLGKKSSIGGKGMQIGEKGQLDMRSGSVEFKAPLFSFGNVSVESEGKISLGPSNGTAHEFRGKRLHSSGELQLGIPPSGSENRRQLSQAPLQAGDVVIGSGGLISTGHIDVPRGSTMTFNSTDIVDIGGRGMDSAGQVHILQGDVTVTAGGIRSEGSIHVKGVRLQFNSTDSSQIGGSGLTIDSGGSATVSAGTVDFTAPFVGTLHRSGTAKIRIDTAVNQTCPTSWDEQHCSRENLNPIVPPRPEKVSGAGSNVLSGFAVVALLATMQQ